LAFSRIQREVSLTRGEGQTSDFNRHLGHPEAQTARARDVNQNLGLDARIESGPAVRTDSSLDRRVFELPVPFAVLNARKAGKQDLFHCDEKLDF